MEGTKKRRVSIGVVGWLGVVVALLCLGGLFLVRAYLDSRLRRQYVMCRVFANNLGAAMKQYQVRFGEGPRGDTDAIFKALRGQNPAKLVFIDVSQSMQDTNGALLDPWRTPYLIETNLTNGLSIRSAGPNRRFGDTDDLNQSL